MDMVYWYSSIAPLLRTVFFFFFFILVVVVVVVVIVVVLVSLDKHPDFYFWGARVCVRVCVKQLQGNVYVQDGIDSSTLRIVYDKAAPGNGGVGAVDPQMSPDGRLVAFVKDGEIFVASGERSFRRWRRRRRGDGRRLLESLGMAALYVLSCLLLHFGF